MERARVCVVLASSELVGGEGSGPVLTEDKTDNPFSGPLSLFPFFLRSSFTSSRVFLAPVIWVATTGSRETPTHKAPSADQDDMGPWTAARDDITKFGGREGGEWWVIAATVGWGQSLAWS